MRYLRGTVLCWGVAVSACVDFPSAAQNPACSTDADYGAFRGRAAGESTDSLAGCGYFTTDTNTFAFAMVVTNGGPLSHTPMVKLFRARRPVTGVVYTIGVGPQPLTGVMFLGSRTFNITSGTFRTKGDDRNPSIYANSYFLDGDLDVSATDSVGAMLTVKGSFQAICLEQTDNSLRGTDPFKKKSKACDPQYAGLKAAR